MKHTIFLRRLHENPSWGGFENILLDYLARVDYKTNRISLVTTKDIFSQKFKEMKIPVRVVEFPIDIRSNKRFKRLFSFLKSLNPNRIVYAQGAFSDFQLSDFLAGFFLTKGNIYALEVLGAPEPEVKISRRYFKNFQGLGLWWYKKMFLISLRGWLCKKILAISEEVKERLVQWYHYPSTKIVTVFHGIDLKRFSADRQIRNKMRTEYNIPDSDLIIISTARLSKEKCIHRLINSFDQLAQDIENIWLFIVGEGPLRYELEELVRDKASFNRIRFLGHQDDVSKFLKLSDIYILPSDIEGLGIALLEAMATGLTSLATKTPGPNEIIVDGVNGFFVDKNEDGVFKGLTKAVRLTEEQKNEISSNARKYVTENFELNSRVKKALQLLRLA